jgi:hypothetical protein
MYYCTVQYITISQSVSQVHLVGSLVLLCSLALHAVDAIEPWYLELHCTALLCTALHCTAPPPSYFLPIEPPLSAIVSQLLALRCTALHYIALHCTALHCAELHCTTLHCTEHSAGSIYLFHTQSSSSDPALHCTALRCTALHYTTLHCTALHCTTLHCTALHYT